MNQRPRRSVYNSLQMLLAERAFLRTIESHKELDPFDHATWSEGERYYFEHADDALKHKTDVLISNGKPEHAVFLTHRFFVHAEYQIRLFSGTLSRKYGNVHIYGNQHIVDALRQLLSDIKSINIVLERPIDVDSDQSADDHPIVRTASELKQEGRLRGTLEIRQANQDALDFLRTHNFLYHWMVMDETAFRLETDIAHTQAHANFGDFNMAATLARLFDRVLYRQSTRLAHIQP